MIYGLFWLLGMGCFVSYLAVGWPNLRWSVLSFAVFIYLGALQVS